jgi:DNA modification methylase
LARRCILLGSREGDTVLDPFGGSGTTGLVASELGRKAILIELNPAYVQISRERTGQLQLFLSLESISPDEQEGTNHATKTRIEAVNS